jgi:hypothetical protein
MLQTNLDTLLFRSKLLQSKLLQVFFSTDPDEWTNPTKKVFIHPNVSGFSALQLTVYYYSHAAILRKAIIFFQKKVLPRCARARAT